MRMHSVVPPGYRWRAEGAACTFAATRPEENRIMRCCTLLLHVIFLYFVDEVGSLWD